MDVLETFMYHLQKSGVSQDVIRSVTGELRNTLGGQSYYIQKDYVSRDKEIRDYYNRTVSYARVAQRFNLSERRVREIVDGK
jgi:Mor family transcriptional regulator